MGKRKASEKTEIEQPVAKKEKVEKWLESKDADTVERKKKRPWRAKVRKEAAKKAKEAEKVKNGDVEVAAAAIVPELPTEKSKKKKRGPKKKKFKPEVIEKKDENKEEESPMELAKKKLDAARFRCLNEQLYCTTGKESFEYFQKDQKAFFAYHKGFRDQTEKWPTNPLDDIIRWIKTKKSKLTIADIGCGDAKLAEALGDKHNVRSFDLVAVNEHVEVCDMANLPIENDTVDIAVFSLSLMGTNLHDFISESRRILKMGGELIIAEVASRIVSLKQFTAAICNMGYEMEKKKQISNYFVLLEFKKVDKKIQKRPYGLVLKPCVYKKR